MWKKYAVYIKQILPLMKNSLLPVLFLYGALCSYLIMAPFNQEWLKFLHIGFFTLCISSICVLLYFNYNRPLFFIISMLISYCLINYLKYTHGIIYNLSSDYNNLVFFSVSCLLFFYFLPNRPLLSKETIQFIIIVFIALALGEHLGRLHISIDIDFVVCNGCGLQIFGLILFITALTIMLIHSSFENDILTTSLFYATINIMLGFYFSNRPSPLAIFYFTAALTIFTGLIHAISYALCKDTITGLDNGNSLIKNSTKLPLKYGLGIICIDDYKHLSQVFKRSGIHEIVCMVANKIQELEPQAQIYRCAADEFIIIFPMAEKGTSFARIDHIRRQIAISNFYLSHRKKPLKLTVSCSTADKKRSDVDVFAVFIRAHKILQKTYKFTPNITSQA